MCEVNKVIYLFYEKREKPSVIAKELDVSKPYVTKIIKQDKRYIQEKEQRRMENKEKQREKNRIAMQKKREEEKELLDDMKLKHRQDVIELSYYTL